MALNTSGPMRAGLIEGTPRADRRTTDFQGHLQSIGYPPPANAGRRSVPQTTRSTAATTSKLPTQTRERMGEIAEGTSLMRVNGIGPKLAGLLEAKGIRSYDEVRMRHCKVLPCASTPIARWPCVVHGMEGSSLADLPNSSLVLAAILLCSSSAYGMPAARTPRRWSTGCSARCREPTHL